MILYRAALKDYRLAEVDRSAWNCSPALLRASRQIYKEAFPVFFEVNTFIFHISDHLEWDLCPIHWKSITFCQIKSLVLFLDRDRMSPTDISCKYLVASLGRLLYGIPGLEIEIRTRDSNIGNVEVDCLAPLKLLRNVKTVNFADSCTFFPYTQDFFDRLFQQIKGNGHVEPAFLMYQNLRNYIQSLEQHPKRKTFMDKRSAWIYGTRHSIFYNRPSIRQLQKARKAALQEELFIFIRWRKKALASQESHYQRIREEKEKLFNDASCLELGARVNRIQKLIDHHFKHNASPQAPNMCGTRAHLALQQFANAFYHEPDMVWQWVLVTKATITSCDSAYRNTERERLLAKLYKAAVKEETLPTEFRELRQRSEMCPGSYDWRECSYYFKKILKDLLGQWNEICRTRQLLFQFDKVPDVRYMVYKENFEDLAEVISTNDDRDIPQDLNAEEMGFGSAQPLPTFAHPFLEKARLEAEREATALSLM